MKIKTKYRFKFSMEDAIHFLIVLFVIFATDALVTKTNQNPSARYATWAVIVLAGVCSFMRYCCHYYFRELAVIAVLILWGMVWNLNLTGGYIFKICLLFCGYAVTRITGWEDFKRYYCDIMYFIAAVSLACFMFHSIIASMTVIPSVSNGQLAFKNMIFSIVPMGNYSIWSWYRNYGIFWEPGVYQLYLNIAIMFTFFGKKKAGIKDIFRIFIYALAILTTFSTAGYFLLSMMAAAILLKSGNQWCRLFVFTAFVAAVFYVMCDDSLRWYVFSKIKRGSESEASRNARLYSITSNLWVAVLHPFGTGPWKFDTEIVRYQNLFGIGEFTNVNMFLQNFAIYGWAYGFYYAYKLWRFAKSLKENCLVTMILYFVLCLGLFNEPLTYSLMFSCVIFFNERQGGYSLNARFCRRRTGVTMIE